MDAITSLTTTQASPGSVSGPQLGKDEFLKLLVAQLSNQDPLNPKEDTEFVAQLAQFSSLEQLMGIGEGVEGLGMAQLASQSADTVGFIGKEVLALTDEIQLGDDGGATLGFNVMSPVEKVVINVRNNAGTVVRTIERTDSFQAGNHTIHWDGLNDDGRPVGRGSYTFEVTASDGGGESSPQPLVKARVSGVTFERGYPELKIGSNKVTLSEVIEINE